MCSKEGKLNQGHSRGLEPKDKDVRVNPGIRKKE